MLSITQYSPEPDSDDAQSLQVQIQSAVQLNFLARLVLGRVEYQEDKFLLRASSPMHTSPLLCIDSAALVVDYLILCSLKQQLFRHSMTITFPLVQAVKQV